MISGLTIIRNGNDYDFPYIQSIYSLLPLVDELVINVGKSSDGTLESIQALNEPKIQILETHWPMNDPEQLQGGRILSDQTNLALDACRGEWCLYLQADEVLHEKDYANLKKNLTSLESRQEIDGLVFDYHHFYGSYNVVQKTRSAYRREVRAIKRSSGARSVGDAQSFRKVDGSKLRVAHAQATVYHYGWVRPPEVMREKTFFMDQLYHGSPDADSAASRTPHSGTNYQYKRFWGLRRFLGSHPQTMHKRIQARGWDWDLENSPFVWTWSDLKKIFLDTIEQLTGVRLFEYRSYRLQK